LKDGTGPALKGLEERHKWADHKELQAWINNPAAYMAKDPYTQGLKAKYGSMMTGFAEITLADVDNIVAYINDAAIVKVAPAAAGGQAPEGDQNAVLFGIISLVLGVIALILMQVNSNLKRMSDDADGLKTPDPIPFFRKKSNIALMSIAFFVFGGFMVAKGAIGMGRQKDYQPEQPIYYSHKVHAGINQISCLYCHGSAWESKHAAIPSTNVCMNCHKAISTYEKGPKLFDEEGKEINGMPDSIPTIRISGILPRRSPSSG
jgi:hypothetical protein